MNKTKLICILLIATLNGAFSQDTIKVMQYNLLNYGNYTSYCTSTNNNISTKNASLKTIIDNTLPDIFTVNEMGAQNSLAIEILDNCLNVNGRTWYGKAGYTNNQNSDIVNMLFYDTRKFTLKWQEVIANNLRDINVYHLYYNSPDISNLQDTAYLTCIVAHLKAGSTSYDEDYRYQMSQAIMQYISGKNKEWNYLLMGDFNVYTANEPAMQEILFYSNSIFRFNDPVNMLGSWNNNSYYAQYHTQSTHTVNDCTASGGLDDRFDFILMSNYIKYGTAKIEYIPGTYKAYGQDGQHFNQDINNPANNVVSSLVADALYNMSDHLPVIMDMKISQTPAKINNNIAKTDFEIFFQNPVNDNLSITVKNQTKTQLLVSIHSLSGQLIVQTRINTTQGTCTHVVNTSKLSKGMYFLTISDEQGNVLQKKINKI